MPSAGSPCRRRNFVIRQGDLRYDRGLSMVRILIAFMLALGVVSGALMGQVVASAESSSCTTEAGCCEAEETLPTEVAIATSPRSVHRIQFRERAVIAGHHTDELLRPPN